MHGGEAQPLRGTERMTAFRLARADRAEQTADVAEQSATRYERNAARGDRGRRLAFARWEREVAAVERENAALLRSAPAGPAGLRTLPSWPWPPS